ncbi:MAG: glycerol-3-phosphate dehydrogenase [Pseudomonadales bacterium]|nr:glycerol-3-phosphate dehydrogenase [Pseudomonadales bacterium]
MNGLKPFDIFVIGGGINGTAIAADAAGRGLRVGLCETHDLGEAAFSRCGKAFHGGIRHLERLKLYTLRKTLKERNILLKRAPYLINAIPFIIPCNEQSKPRWMLQSRLALYDLLGNKYLRPYISHRSLPKKPLECLNPSAGKWLSYPECEIDDSRLVISNALCAAENQAKILPRTRCHSAEPIEHGWRIVLEDIVTKERQQVESKTIVNATGAQVEKTISDTLNSNTRCHTELVKHNFVIVKKFYDGQVGYKLQKNKRQVMTLSPLGEDYCLVGPLVESYSSKNNSDELHSGERESESEGKSETKPENNCVNDDVIRRLLNIVNPLLDTPIKSSDIVSSYSHIRAIYRDPTGPSGTAQDYVLDFSCTKGSNPIVSVIGGSLLTHRVLAEQTLELLSPYLPHLKKPWTADSFLPGGELPGENRNGQHHEKEDSDLANYRLNSLLKQLKEKYPQLPVPLLQRLSTCYGTRSFKLLGDKQKIEELGQHFGHHLYEVECDFLVEYEWADNANDVIWRRSQLGLLFDADQQKALSQWFDKAYQYKPAVRQLSAS